LGSAHRPATGEQRDDALLEGGVARALGEREQINLTLPGARTRRPDRPTATTSALLQTNGEDLDERYREAPALAKRPGVLDAEEGRRGVERPPAARRKDRQIKGERDAESEQDHAVQEEQDEEHRRETDRDRLDPRPGAVELDRSVSPHPMIAAVVPPHP